MGVPSGLIPDARGFLGGALGSMDFRGARGLGAGLKEQQRRVSFRGRLKSGRGEAREKDEEGGKHSRLHLLQLDGSHMNEEPSLHRHTRELWSVDRSGRVVDERIVDVVVVLLLLSLSSLLGSLLQKENETRSNGREKRSARLSLSLSHPPTPTPTPTPAHFLRVDSLTSSAPYFSSNNLAIVSSSVSFFFSPSSFLLTSSSFCPLMLQMLMTS